jgi:hypothetical protein
MVYPICFFPWCMHQYSYQPGNEISIFIREDDIPPPLLMTPVLMLGSHQQTLLPMTNCKDGSSGRSTTPYFVDYQSTSESTIINWSLVVTNCRLCCLYVSSESNIHMLWKVLPILMGVVILGRSPHARSLILTSCYNVPVDVGLYFS